MKEKKANNDRLLRNESKLSVKRLELDDEGKEIKDGVQLCLNSQYVDENMIKVPMSQFMGQYRNNLVFSALLNQSIINNNSLIVEKAEKVGIRVRRSLGPIDYKQLFKGKLEANCQSFNLFTQTAFWTWSKLVEERLDKRGENHHEE